MPVLLWLNQNTNLRGKIINPITTVDGSYRVEDENYVYILFEYINGTVIAKNPLTRTQVLELAEIMAQLHSCNLEIPIKAERMIENFEVPFCDSLDKYMTEDYAVAPEDVKSILHPCMEQLLLKISQLKSLSKATKQMNSPKVLCHTDAHGWNLMQSDHLVLVDWEGMKLAPAEADLFMFAVKDYWAEFYSHYSRIRSTFELNRTLLAFYSIRRKLEDIWAFLESILYDGLSEKQRAEELNYLANECKNLDAFCF